MAVAPSQTRTVNKALALLGSAKRIANITDGSSAALTAQALWDDALSTVLSEHPWHFAIKRDALPADVEAPAFDWAYRYELPGDCLRWLPWGQSDQYAFDGEQEGSFILTDQVAPLRIRYIARVENMLLYTPEFLEALAAKLAWEMAEPITGGLEGIADRMKTKYEEALDNAKAKNGISSGSRSRQVVEGSNWNAARQGYAQPGCDS